MRGKCANLAGSLLGDNCFSLIYYISHFRVRNLNAMPEVREKIYDPDPNKAYTKAKLAKLRENNNNLAAAAIHNESTNSFLKFPSNDSAFSKDFSVLPIFVPTDTLDHLKRCGKTTKKSADDEAVVEMSSSKGLKMIPFVHNMETSKTDGSDVVYVRALCWASYKKCVKYKVRMVVNPKGKPKIVSAECDRICPAGKSGCCCHVMAVIWKLDDMSRNKQLCKPFDDDRPCTSKPRKWGIPGRREVEHTPVMMSKILKPRHQTDTPGRKRRGVLPTLFDPRPLKSRNLDPKAVEKLRDRVIEINPNIPFAKMTPNSTDISLVDTVIGLVAKGSVLHLQLKGFSNGTITGIGSATSTNIGTGLPNTGIGSETSTSVLQPKSLPNSNFSNSTSTFVESETITSVQQPEPSTRGYKENSYPIISPPKQLPISIAEIGERCKQIKRKLFSVDESKVDQIERETRGQSNNPKWFEHRFGRVTASKCHRVACPHRSNTSPSKIVKDILQYNSCIQTKAMREGINNESLAVTQYVHKMQQEGHCGLKVENCGFFVSKKNGIVGASPDGLVTDPVSENPLGIIEVKNITVNSNESLLTALVRKSICTKEGEVNRSHKYFYQVQQQLYVVNRSWCDFVVRGSNGKLFCKRVPFDQSWWSEKLKVLESFYESHILPELAYPRLRDGLDRYDFHNFAQAK